jgi:hypothetical protein
MRTMLTIGATRSAAAGARQRFRRLYAVSLALHSLIAAAGLLLPVWIAGIIGMQPAADAVPWIRVWGGLVLVTSLFQIPGLMDPIDGRVVVIIGIIGRFAMALLFLCLGGAFLWLAALDGLFGIVLLVAFQRLIVAEIMTRP